MIDTLSWQSLEAKYRRAMLEPDSVGKWIEIWRLFIEDQWYQGQLDRSARLILRRNALPHEWLNDLKHDAILLLARKLRHAVDLTVNSPSAEGHFPAWISKIIQRDCQEALRRLRRMHRESMRVLEEDVPQSRVVDIEAQVDLSLAIDTLAEPERTVLALATKGRSLKEIAGDLALGYWQVWRAWRRGTEILAEKLRG